MVTILGVARIHAEKDGKLPAGTPVDLAGLGLGVYRRFEKKKIGSNKHWIDFQVFDPKTARTVSTLKPVEFKNFSKWTIGGDEAALALVGR